MSKDNAVEHECWLCKKDTMTIPIMPGLKCTNCGATETKLPTVKAPKIVKFHQASTKDMRGY